MAENFVSGDDLVFQLESGFGLLRVIAVEEREGQRIWHLLAYEEVFPDIESAERALRRPGLREIRKAHMAVAQGALERTPAARLGNRTGTDAERGAYEACVEG